MPHDNDPDHLDRRDDVVSESRDRFGAGDDVGSLDDLAEADDLDGYGDAGAPAPAPGGRAAPLAVGFAVGFAVLSLVLLLLLVHERSQNKSARADSSERTTVETTASRVAEALVSVDASGSTKGADVVRALGTGPLIQQFDEANAAVRQTFGPLKIQSISGQVKEVYVKDIDGSEADVIVVLNLVIVGDNPRVDQNHYLRVHLAKLNGTWKVDNVQDVNLALSGAGGTGTPTPTTAPASGSSQTSSSSP